MGAARWRLGSKTRSAGTYWFLETGRDKDRRGLALRYVTEEQARRALSRMQAEENAGTSARVLGLHAVDPEKAVSYLLGTQEAPLDAELEAAQRVVPGQLTVAEYFDTIFWPVRSDSRTDIGVAESTAKTELGFWRNVAAGRGILDGEIGRTRMRDLNDQHWVRWETSQTQLSGRSRVLRRAAYAALLSFARRQGHITFKPEFYRVKGATKRTREQSDPLSLDEVQSLLNAAIRPRPPAAEATAAGPMHRCMWAVGVGQGLRPSELVRVHWEDIDWNALVLQVRGTKTDESAAPVPLTPLAFTELRSYWMQLGQPSEGPCFTYLGRPILQFKKALAGDAAAAGITRKVYPYLLRHSFATIAWSIGVDRDVARRILRHTDLAMLDRVYCRPRPKDLVAKVAAFALPGTT